MIKAKSSAIEDKLEKEPHDQKLMAHLSRYTKRLAITLTTYEYLATMSMIAQRNSNFVFSNGGELYWPHAILKTGYNKARHRRIIMSHLDFMGWMVELQQAEELFDIAIDII